MLVELGDLLRAQDATPGACARYNEAIALESELGQKGGAAEARLHLAAALLDARRAGEAETHARQAAQSFREEGRRDEEALAQALLASASVERPADARAALEHALGLVRRSQNVELRLSTGLWAARVDARLGRVAAARSRLVALLAESERLGLVPAELEARLDLGELELRSDAAAGQGRLRALAASARARGFTAIARRAESAAAAHAARP